MPDDGWQSERRNTEQDDNDEGRSEIPGQRIDAWVWSRRVMKRTLGYIQELAAVLAFYGLILDFLSTIWTLFHGGR